MLVSNAWYSSGMGIMCRRIVCYLIVMAAPLLASQQVQPRVNELDQYVATARTAGQSDEQIRRNAVAAGWAETAVTGAINSTRQAKSALTPKVSTPVAVAMARAKTEGTPPTVPPNSDVSPGVPAGGERPHASRGVPYDYQIGAGDVLQVNVWKEPDVSVPTAVVRPDGKISLPLLKDVSVLGLTPKQAENMITQELGQFITGADVTVVVAEINSKKVYLLGAVKKEGPLPYTYRMSVMQAISEGGGLTDYAKRKKIYVLRTENGQQFRLPFNYDAVLKGEHMELNIALLPDDTVVVPH
jgi:polysaccharide export outer membrane protein